jgi:arylsulfatase A-like enzyme
MFGAEEPTIAHPIPRGRRVRIAQIALLSMRQPVAIAPRRRRGGPPARRRGRAWPLLVLLPFAVACGPHDPVLPRLPPTRGLILISLDTLRADRLSTYGHQRQTSPFLDSLAARGVLFEQAVAQYPNTLASHISIFTGLYPPEHGVYPPDALLSDRIPTLPETLGAHGFRTAGFTEGGFARRRYFARGFDRFNSRAAGELGDIETTFRRALSFLRRLRSEDRFFLFVQTYATHAPYRAPAGYLERYWPGPPPDPLPPADESFRHFNVSGATMPEEAVAYYLARYDGAIRYADQVVAEFFARLEELDLRDETTVIITSDHGEAFFEHGKMGHIQVYHEDLHVPLIVVHPDQPAPRRVEALVESVDLAPTIYALLGVSPSFSMSGRSLAPHLTRASEERPRQAWAESRRQRALYHQTDNQLYQLVVTTLPPNAWIARRTTFDVRVPEVEIEVTSFQVARTLRMEIDGRPHAAHEIGTTPRTIRVTLPTAEATHRITLSSDGCTVPPQVKNGARGSCRSFRLASPVRRTELFELMSDPHGSRDLSRSEPALFRQLVRQLEGRTFRVVAPPRHEPLDPDLETRLRALGYLD